MIRFSDISSGSLRLENVDDHKEIKTLDKTSLQEIDSFWKSEFEKAHREAMLEPNDKLLEEVYDVSEDDISIDYEVSDQVKEILTDFKFVNWMTLDDSERLTRSKNLLMLSVMSLRSKTSRRSFLPMKTRIFSALMIRRRIPSFLIERVLLTPGSLWIQ